MSSHIQNLHKSFGLRKRVKFVLSVGTLRFVPILKRKMFMFTNGSDVCQFGNSEAFFEIVYLIRNLH